MLKKCPTCRAKYAGNPICRRCGTDLGKLVDIEKRAGAHLLEARIAYLQQDYTSMLRHARRSVSLRRGDEALKVLACAALLNREFEEARSVYKLLRPPPKA